MQLVNFSDYNLTVYKDFIIDISSKTEEKYSNKIEITINYECRIQSKFYFKSDMRPYFHLVDKEFIIRIRKKLIVKNPCVKWGQIIAHFHNRQVFSQPRTISSIYSNNGLCPQLLRAYANSRVPKTSRGHFSAHQKARRRRDASNCHPAPSNDRLDR